MSTIFPCEGCGKSIIRHAGGHRFCSPCGYKRSLEHFRHVRRATAMVHAAIKAGKLASPRGLSCRDCGGSATEYDHRDYSKPLQVEPVCHPCNKRRGPGLRSERAA